jgi:hypothetical protein
MVLRVAGLRKAGRLSAGAVSLLMVASVAAPLSPAAKRNSGTLAMDDGVPIADALVLPEGAVPAGGWPVVVLPGGVMD